MSKKQPKDLNKGQSDQSLKEQIKELKALNKKLTETVDDQSGKIKQFNRKLLMQRDDIEDYKKKLGGQGENLQNIRNSFSYKLGGFLTFPFRFIYDLFKGKSSSIQRNIIYNIDKASIYEGAIVCTGWALGKDQIKSLEFINPENGQTLGLAIYGIERPDVMKAYPKYYSPMRSGFIFNGYVKNDISSLKLIVTNHKGKTKEGIVELKNSPSDLISKLPLAQQYQIYVERNAFNDGKRAAVKTVISNFKLKPKVSLACPVYNTDAAFLEECIDSVLNQLYENWELCLHDDASTKAETIAVLKKYASKDKRIKISRSDKNENISLASNHAIANATGEYVALLDHDDVLCEDALFEMIKAINKNPALDFIYSDEDKIDESGNYLEPYFKSGFSIDLLCSYNYICHFSMIRKTLGDQIGWFRAGYEGAQDHDLFLRIANQSKQIAHIPKILYHWRKTENSTSSNFEVKGYALDAGSKALMDFFEERKEAVVIEKGYREGSYKVVRKIEKAEKISIIIPFKDQVELLKTCLQSIAEKTTYTDYEILLVSNNSEEQVTFDYLKTLEGSDHIFIHEYNVPFNYSEINNWAVEQAKGKHILLLNNDTAVITEDWLTRMAEHIHRPEVGAVGARLLYPDDTIQHAGVILGLGGVAGHAFKGLPAEGMHHPSIMAIKNLSACTAACLLIKKSVFKEVGGLDAKNFKIAFNDIDLCLKIREAGHLIVYTPFAELYHSESKSRGLEDTPEKIDRFSNEVKMMQKKWDKNLKFDPYYNVNLTLDREDFSMNAHKLKQK